MNTNEHNYCIVAVTHQNKGKADKATKGHIGTMVKTQDLKFCLFFLPYIYKTNKSNNSKNSNDLCVIASFDTTILFNDINRLFSALFVFFVLFELYTQIIGFICFSCLQCQKTSIKRELLIAGRCLIY